MQKTYNFDEYVERRGTGAVKYDFSVMGKPEGLIPMWIADMDFRAADEVSMAIRGLADHGVYGYTEPLGVYYEAVSGWFERRLGYRPKKEWFVITPGMVFAIAMAIRAYTSEGEGVLIQSPVYPPFRKTIRDNGRIVVDSQLVYDEDERRYKPDFGDFERKIIENGVRLFLLCSPHNPVMRVWTPAELLEVGRICQKHNVIVFSDEIHCDFVYPRHTHHVFTTLDEAFAKFTLVATAPSKTFNIAGLQISNIFIAEEGLRRRFSLEIAKSGFSHPGMPGVLACMAAYKSGENWFEQILQYLTGNVAVLEAFLERMPISMPKPEGSFVMWLDLRALGLPHEELDEFLIKKAGLWLSSGTAFGEQGRGFWRMNIGCSRPTLEAALARLEKAVSTQCL